MSIVHVDKIWVEIALEKILKCGRPGGGGVKKGQIFADVLYGWPLTTITTATAYTPCLALYPCYHVLLPLFARGRLFYYQIWSVTNKQQTQNQSL